MSKEAPRYISNAKELLTKSPIEHDRYTDVKYVKQACGTAYLAILKALDDYLVSHGVLTKELPKSVEAYRTAIKKHLAAHNGKLMGDFNSLYDELHIAGYYRGLFTHTNMVKQAIKNAENFIKVVEK